MPAQRPPEWSELEADPKWSTLDREQKRVVLANWGSTVADYVAENGGFNPDTETSFKTTLAGIAEKHDLVPGVGEKTGQWFTDAWHNLSRGALNDFVGGVIEAPLRVAENVLPNDWVDAESAANAVAGFRKAVDEAHPVRPEFAESIPGQVVRGLGQAIPNVALGALRLPGLAAGAVAQSFDQGYQDAVQSGTTPSEAFKSGVANLPGAIPEYYADKVALGGLMSAAKVAPLKREIVKAIATGAASEATQQTWSNAVASYIVGYDKERELTQDVGNSALVGGLTEGIVRAGTSVAENAAARSGHKEFAQQLDTAKNIPESTKTLLLQQDQLRRGLRPAQMFPAGTTPLPMIDGMEQVKNERGVFHFNPKQITAAEILSASRDGKENEILGLGPVSKPAAQARAAATGEKLVAVAERAADGTEIKTTIGTTGTAPAQVAALEASKSPGSTVKVEEIGKTIVERQRAAQAAVEQKAREEKLAEDTRRAEAQARRDGDKLRFEETLLAADALEQDRAAAWPAVNGALKSLSNFVDDTSYALTQQQREAALKRIARLQPRAEQLKVGHDAAADARFNADKAAAAAAEKAKQEKVRADQARIDAIDATGRDPSTNRIVQIENLTDDDLADVGNDLQKNGLTPQSYEAELMRRERQAAEEGNRSNFTLRDLFVGKKSALNAAGLTAPLRLPTPKTETERGGLGGELKTLRESSGAFAFFQNNAPALDRMAQTLRGLGFKVQTENDVVELVGRAFGGEDVRPETEGEVEFAAAARRVEPIATGITESAATLASKEIPAATNPTVKQSLTVAALPNVEVERLRAAHAKALGPRMADLDLRVGLLAELLEQEGYPKAAANLRANKLGEAEAVVANRRAPQFRAEIVRLRQEQAFILVSAKAAADGKMTGLISHELAHRYWDTLPEDAKAIERAAADRALANKTGPLFNAQGEKQTNIAITAEELRAAGLSATLEADPDLVYKEYFAELTRIENERYLGNRVEASSAPAHTRRLLARLRQWLQEVFDAVRRTTGRADLSREGFREWLAGASQEQTNRTALAYATRRAPAFATTQQIKTETPEFKRWFGSSKVVDDSGKPRVVYHGTGNAGFSVFNNLSWFADSQDIASGYSKQIPAGKTEAENQAVYPVYIAIKNPKRVDFFALRDDVEKWLSPNSKYDGIIIDRSMVPNSRGNFYVVKSPTQIKSAIGNNGNYDPAEPRIDQATQATFDLGGMSPGLPLPNAIRNLTPRWQNKILRFDSNLDKALYYAGGEGKTETRTATIDHLARETGLSTGQIASLARTLREKISPLAASTATDGTLRIPALMENEAAKLASPAKPAQPSSSENQQQDTGTTIARYVDGNGTSAQKRAEAIQQISAVHAIADNRKLDESDYLQAAGGKNNNENDANSGADSDEALRNRGRVDQAAKQERARRALTNPEKMLERALLDDNRISSIIPELVANPRRSWDIRGAVIKTPSDLLALTQILRTPYAETGKVILVNSRNEVVHAEIISIGTTTSTYFAPSHLAQVLARAPKTTEPYGIIVSHNHPSGDPTPSAPDMRMTRVFIDAAQSAGHYLLDHVVTNGKRYYSFKETGVIAEPTGATSFTDLAPAARGAEADPDLSANQTRAPWEVVAREDLKAINSPYDASVFLATARQVAPDAMHVIYVNRRNQMVSFERIPKATELSAQAMRQRLFESMGREGATGLFVDMPDSLSGVDSMRTMRMLREFATKTDFVLLDVTGKFQGSNTHDSAKMMGFISEPGQKSFGGVGEDAKRPMDRRATADQTAIMPSHPWPKDFPDVLWHAEQTAISAHPDYKAAKAGDSAAAVRLVDAFINRDKAADLAQKYPEAIILPVHAEEAGGRNAIPITYAARMAMLSGLPLETQIVQSNRRYATGKDGLYRWANRATFEGPVETGRDYIIMDDMRSMGGTLAALRNHIEDGGGRVVLASTLGADSRRLAQDRVTLAPRPEVIAELDRRFGLNQISNTLNELGIAQDARHLTGPEATWLSTWRGSLDEFRDRVLALRRGNEGQGGVSTVSPSGPSSGPEGGVSYATSQRDQDSAVQEPTAPTNAAAALKAALPAGVTTAAALEREQEAEQATLSEAAREARHPAAVGATEPGEAWASVAKMAEKQLTEERASIAKHLDEYALDLADIEKAHLQGRTAALKAEIERRADPVERATKVTALPKMDRKEALKTELDRGRRLRDDGLKTGNDTAANEGTRIVKAATARLDEEYPGWDAKKPVVKDSLITATKPAPAALATQDDGRNLPPTAPPEPPENGAPRPDDAAPDRGRARAAFGHSAYTPNFLERTTERLRSMAVGFRGAIPELPAFPALAAKTDRFIRDQGPAFYNNLKAFYRTLSSANDYVQRTAEEQVDAITGPLMKTGVAFDATAYAQLKKRQEQARRLKAEGKLMPAGAGAELDALQSQLEAHPYVLFNKLVYFMDLDWRGRNLKDSEGNPIKLPDGLNQTEIDNELARLGGLIAASPHAQLIETAFDRHMALVKQTAEDLKTRDLLAAQHLDNPYYFPHLTLEITRGDKVIERELRPERVRVGTEADFRGYLQEPTGSLKPIESDYVRAVYYHLVQVGAHNLKADAIRDHARSYDVMEQVKDRAKVLSKQRGRSVSWEEVFHSEYAPAGYVLYGTDSRDAFPSVMVDRDKLARRLGEALTSADLHEQLKELGVKGIKLLPEDLKETLIQGQRETWIVPARVAEALRGIADRQKKTSEPIESAIKKVNGAWKGWKLFMPQNHIRYEYGNIVADLEKLFSASPRTFKYLGQSAKEMRAFFQGEAPSADLRAALKDGVINAITAAEMNQLQRLRAFEKFQTVGERITTQLKKRSSSALYQPITNMVGLGDLSSVELSALREGVTRYANYLANLEAIRNNARPDYAGAYWRDIEAIGDSRPGANDKAQRQAAQISKATFGDYGDLSTNGQYLRDKLIPFYSWIEVNFKYHANLLRNLRDQVRGDIDGGTGNAAATAARVAGARAGGFVLRLALPYAAVMLWNAMGPHGVDDDDLSEEDRRRFHIRLGKDENGKPQVVYTNTALADVTKWFSGPKFAQAATAWVTGKTDFVTAIDSWAKDIPGDFANNTIGSAGPVIKLPATAILKKNFFPDVLDARTIPDYDMRRAIISQMTDDFTADRIEATVNKDYLAPKDLGTWAKQLVLQVRQRDPESWAFYGIKDKAAEWVEKRTGQSRDSSYNAPDQQVLRNFRRAIYQGDPETAAKFYLRLLDLGYTSDRFTASIRAQEPLAGVPKDLRRDFVASLSEGERAQLERAYQFYVRMSTSKGTERALFPRKEWGERGQQYYQANPRVGVLTQTMQRTEAMAEEELVARAKWEMQRSLMRN
jgi:hypothetical protein